MTSLASILTRILNVDIAWFLAGEFNRLIHDFGEQIELGLMPDSILLRVYFAWNQDAPDVLYYFIPNLCKSIEVM